MLSMSSFRSWMPNTNSFKAGKLDKLENSQTDTTFVLKIVKGESFNAERTY